MNSATTVQMSAQSIPHSSLQQGRSGRKSDAAFTLLELIVVIAIIAILAGLIMPVLGKQKLKAQGLQCMSNNRQLALAWRMYSEDNNGLLLSASRNPLYPEFDSNVWVLGNLDFDPTNRSNWDPEADIKKSPLWKYSGNSTYIWKCPADKSSVVVNGESKPRVRSMSMNFWMGGFAGYGLEGLVYGGTNWLVFHKMDQVIKVGSSQFFLFIDMREDSIDSGNFATDMTGWPDHPEQTSFLDLPGSYHHRAGGISFVDGHAEIKRWKDDRTMPPLVSGGMVTDQFSSPNNQDIIWLQERATGKR